MLWVLSTSSKVDNWSPVRVRYRTMYSISQEICTRFLLCCALLWLYIDWFFPYPPDLLRWHCGNLTIAPMPAKQPWWIWINTSCEIIKNDYITTTKGNTTKPCAYLLGYTVWRNIYPWFCSAVHCCHCLIHVIIGLVKSIYTILHEYFTGSGVIETSIDSSAVH